jgi:hypothetical protein
MLLDRPGSVRGPRWSTLRPIAALALIVAVAPLVTASVTATGHGIERGASASETADRLGRRQITPALPPSAQPVDTSRPDRIIGTGTAASCTSTGVVAAVAAGGIITFDCGPNPVVIEMHETAKVVNTSPTVVLDGGGLVTLSGRDTRRILYMNTCDPAQTWTTPHCQNQDHPRLTIQNLTFTRGNATGQLTIDGGGGGGSGGAVYVRGGQVRILDSVFTSNRCDPTGPDVGGAALRILSQFEGGPVIVAGSTFGGSPASGNVCSNGGAISSIGVSWEIYDSEFSHNRASGSGANPARPGTPGGGNGGAIYLDGNRFTLDLVDSSISDNTASEGGPAIFFVSNDRSGELRITGSELRRNTGERFGTPGFPGIFFLGRGSPVVTASTIR